MNSNRLSLVNSFVCPQCERHFPIFPRTFQRTTRGNFSLFPYLRCSNCEAICRAVVNVRSAMWAWPVSILMLGLWYATLKTTSFGVELRHAHPSWYGILAGLGLGLIGALGLR